MSKKLRDWVRLDSKNIPVQGSNIRRPKKPTDGRWMEIEKIDCCGPTLTYEAEATIVSPTFELQCDGNAIFTVIFDTTTNSLVELIGLLNKNLGFLGYFSLNEDGEIVFQVKSVVKNTFCPDDDLTFTVVAD